MFRGVEMLLKCWITSKLLIPGTLRKCVNNILFGKYFFHMKKDVILLYYLHHILGIASLCRYKCRLLEKINVKNTAAIFELSRILPSTMYFWNNNAVYPAAVYRFFVPNYQDIHRSYKNYRTSHTQGMYYLDKKYSMGIKLNS